MGWSRSISGYPVCYMVLWAEKHKLPQTVINKIKQDTITGTRLLEMAQKTGGKGLQEGLGASKKVADKIHKALGDKRGPILKWKQLQWFVICLHETEVPMVVCPILFKEQMKMRIHYCGRCTGMSQSDIRHMWHSLQFRLCWSLS